ncbi:MAG: Hcp family type VI secretion system effector [Gemmatimonadota bacterium]
MKRAFLALLVGSILLPVPSVAQDKMSRVKVQFPSDAAPGYMRIGGIDGESLDEDHDKWMDVISIDWPSGAAEPSGPGAGEVVITRKLDTSSPRLVEAIAQGAALPLVVLHAPGGRNRTSYQAFELENVRITSYSISTAGNVPTESIAFQFEKIDIKDGPVIKGQKILQN